MKLISCPEKTKLSHIPRVQFAVTSEVCELGFGPFVLTEGIWVEGTGLDWRLKIFSGKLDVSIILLDFQ